MIALALASGCAAEAPTRAPTPAPAKPPGLAGVIVLPDGQGVGLVAFDDDGAAFIQCNPATGDRMFGYPAIVDPATGRVAFNSGDVTVSNRSPDLNIEGPGATQAVICFSDDKKLRAGNQPNMALFFTTGGQEITSAPVGAVRGDSPDVNRTTPPDEVANKTLPEACDQLGRKVANLMGGAFTGDSLTPPLPPCASPSSPTVPALTTGPASRTPMPGSSRRSPTTRRS